MLLAFALQSFAIEGIKLIVRCPDVVLSWPSVEGETYIVQHRETLDPELWVTLTNSLPAESSPTLALKAPVYRLRLVLLMVLLFSQLQQNLKSLT